MENSLNLVFMKYLIAILFSISVFFLTAPEFAHAQSKSFMPTEVQKDERFITGKFAALLIMLSAGGAFFAFMASGGQGGRSKNFLVTGLVLSAFAGYLFWTRLIAYSGAGDRFEDGGGDNRAFKVIREEDPWKKVE